MSYSRPQKLLININDIPPSANSRREKCKRNEFRMNVPQATVCSLQCTTPGAHAHILMLSGVASPRVHQPQWSIKLERRRKTQYPLKKLVHSNELTRMQDGRENLHSPTTPNKFKLKLVLHKNKKVAMGWEVQH